MPRSVFKKTFPSSTRHLGDVRGFVEHCFADTEVEDGTVEQFKIAVDEACTNVIKHAYHGEPDKPIDVTVLLDPDRCTVRIRDAGDSFHVAQYAAPNLAESVRRRKQGGYGVHIMRRLMDRVEYRTRGRFNEVSLTKYLTSAPQTNGDGHA